MVERSLAQQLGGLPVWLATAQRLVAPRD